MSNSDDVKPALTASEWAQAAGFRFAGYRIVTDAGLPKDTALLVSRIQWAGGECYDAVKVTGLQSLGWPRDFALPHVTDEDD